jgi:CheY-like chemotaxis protein
LKFAILLVDDDVLVLEFTAELLSALGHRVTTARSGDEALAILADGHAIDTLVTDVQMPGLNGFELARRARNLQPGLMILYCTGHPASIEHHLGAALGPVVTKPCTAERLQLEIERLRS